MVKEQEAGLFTCLYTPTSAQKHTVSTTWGGVSVPGSPFRVSNQTGNEVTVNTTGERDVRNSAILQLMVEGISGAKSEVKDGKKPKPLIIITTFERETFELSQLKMY